MDYKILRVENIALAQMRIHPDALAIGAGADDRGFLGCSVEDVGVLEPLTVVGGDGDYLIIDGVGRYKSAGDLGLETVPCLVVACDDTRGFVMHKNPMGRKRSTGSRLLCFGLLHQDDVIKGYLGSRDPRVCQKAAESLKRWLPGKIAERLFVSRKDVTLAAELLFCHVKDVDLDGVEIGDDDVRTKLRKVFNKVLQGEIPVRRWKSAFAGAVNGTQAGASGKDMADYEAVVSRGFKNVQSAWKNWDKVPVASVPELRNEFRIMIEEAPQCMRYEFADAITTTWSCSERAALLKRLKESITGEKK